MPAVLSKFDMNPAQARDDFVTAMWNDSLPSEIEQQLRRRPTSTGTWYSDLLSLENQYQTALSVVNAAGFNRQPSTTDLDNNSKKKCILIAKTLINGSEPTPESEWTVR
jgi:hypothetical protein